MSVKETKVVDWDGPSDPENPMNWATYRKWACVALVSSITFVTSLASTIFAPGVPLLMKEFHSSNEELESFVVSVYIVGFCFGPLVVAPMSELYGRSPILHISNILFLIFTIASAVSSDLPMFIIFRLCMGLAGCAPLTVGGGVIADLMPPAKRSKALSSWILGPLMGPVIGPVAGGFLTQAKGWRWSIWLVSIIASALTLTSFVFLRETYALTILSQKTAQLQKSDPSSLYKSKFDKDETPRELFLKAIVRPTKMLFLSPIVLILALDMSIMYSYIYLLVTTFTFVFESSYNFNAGEAGLVYLGLGAGFLIGVFGCNTFSEKFIKQKISNGDTIKPEAHLTPLILGAFLVPIGLFVYGWTSFFHVFWLVPIIGTAFVGIGVICAFMPIQMYLIDAFTVYAASAIATNTVLRSLFGAVLPLAGQKMYASLGLGWGNSLLAFIALALSPVPFVLMRYGESIRTNPRFQLDL